MSSLHKKAILATISAALSLMIGVGCSSSSSSSHLLYVASSSGVFGFRIDNKSGSPTKIFSAPFTLGRSPSAIVVNPAGTLAYVANELDNTISTLKIDRASGSLTEVLPRTTTAGLAPSAMVMDSAGSFIFVVEQGTPDISVYSVGSDGTLQIASTVLLGSLPSNMTLADSGSLLFVALPNASAVDVFSVSSGTLTRGGGAPFRVPNGVAAISVDQDTSFLYAAGLATNTISGFSISPAGVLTELPTSPYGSATLKTPVATFVEPSGTHLYAANSAATALSEFTIGSTGDLTAVTTGAPSAGTKPSFFVLDPSATYVYVANSGSSSLTQFKLNSDGTLAKTNTVQVGAVPRAVAFTK